MPASPPLPLRRGGLAALLFVVLMIHAGRASGSDSSEPDARRKAEASAHLKRGAELIDAEDLEGALAQFEAAYRLVPSPSILHNFGIVYQGLGRKAAALEAFQRFLEEAAKAPPAAREHAQRAVQTLRGEVAELRLRSDVAAGASIFVDARKVGQTPQERPIYLDPGRHHVSVEKAGLGTLHAERIEVGAGEQLTVPARPAATPPPLAAEVSESAPAIPLRPWQRPAAWATAVAATVAGGVFATAMVVRYIRFTDFNDKGCGTDDPQPRQPDCSSLLAKGNTAEKWATVSGVAAGALGVGATVLFLTLPQAPVHVSLRASPSALGLRLQGRF